ncbi:DUF6122 family protein [Sinimarinibacterium thermocellulolyticum]|uniref:DUF6122 family protein n=1 Tax=Sinimarinibacterium thermocellulolyticum TaxID=3170016 RepID=A0ABV2ACZ5_9GAMM
MSIAAIVHLILHGLVPGLAARLLFYGHWRRAWIVMLATMAVDLDHLLADPIYDPARCSLAVHPLHRPPAIVAYAALLVPVQTRIVATGLLIHMTLDACDCVIQRA